MDKNYETVRRITLAINKMDGAYYLLARHYQINENTLIFLYALDDGHPHSQREISDEWLIPRTTINSLVKKLLSDGYIAFTGEQHAKEKALILTEKGRAYTSSLFHEIYLAEEQAITNTLQNFSPEFVTALESFSEQLQAGFHEIICRKSEKES